MASAAGKKWRALSEEEKKGYEEASQKAKVHLQKLKKNPEQQKDTAS